MFLSEIEESEIKKPSWSMTELNEKLKRWDELRYEVEDHDGDCPCPRCLEYFSISALLQKFSESEKASAISEANKEIQNEFWRI